MNPEGLVDVNKISPILVATDGSITGEAAFTVALEEAAVRGAFLHTVYVIDPDRYLDLAYDADAEYLYEGSERVRPGPIQEEVNIIQKRLSGRAVLAGVGFELHTRVGDARSEILAVAEECRADRIVVSSTGKTVVNYHALKDVASCFIDNTCTTEI